MVKDHLLDKYSENELLSENFRVYTTLDPALQRAAAGAVDAGMKNVDLLLAKKYDKWRRDQAKKGNSEAPIRRRKSLSRLDRGLDDAVADGVTASLRSRREEFSGRRAADAPMNLQNAEYPCVKLDFRLVAIVVRRRDHRPRPSIDAYPMPPS